MATRTTSRLNPPALEAMPDGFEFFMTECENVSSPTPDGEPEPSFRTCTVLVSFAKSNAERAALRPLLTALSYGETKTGVVTGSDWLEKLVRSLSERLNAADHGLVTAVIYTGSDSDSDAETVQAATDAIRQCFGANLAALLVVADTSLHRFNQVQGVTGFVIGASKTSAETARSMFLCLAMLSAPNTLNGIDLVDLLPALGTASAPAVLADALWLRDGEGRLVFASVADAATVRCAARIVAVPLIQGPWGWAELRRLSQAVAAEAIEASSEIVFAADGPLAPRLCSTQVSMVPILCTTLSG